MSHPKVSQSLEVAPQVQRRNLFPLGKKGLGIVWEGFPVEAAQRQGEEDPECSGLGGEGGKAAGQQLIFPGHF